MESGEKIKLIRLAEIANTLANEWQGKKHNEVNVEDEVGQVENALNAIAASLGTQMRRQSAQYAATKALAEANNIDDAMPDILKAICTGLGWQWSAMWTIDSEAELLRCSRIWQAPMAHMDEFTRFSREFTFSYGAGLLGHVWKSGAPSWIIDVQVDPNFLRAAVAEKVGLRGAFCFPIKGAFGVLGVMEFLTTTPEEPDNSLLAMFNAIGSQIGQFIERKLFEEQYSKKTAELEAIHKELERDFALRMQDSMRMRAQHAATKVLADSPSLSEATPQLLQAICIGLEWECAMMWELDEGENALHWVNSWHVEDGDFSAFENMSRNMVFHIGKGLPGRVWESGNPHWILDVVKDRNFPRAQVAGMTDLHGAFAFPVKLADRVLGVMEFFSRKVQEPDDALLTMMAAVGSQVGQFVERKMAESRVQIYLKEVEKEKERSQELLHVILPPNIVRELEDTNSVQSRRHENVAVLFCDIVGFTKYCDGLGPNSVRNLLC